MGGWGMDPIPGIIIISYINPANLTSGLRSWPSLQANCGSSLPEYYENIPAAQTHVSGPDRVGQWTKSSNEAVDFPNYDRAIDFAVQHALADVQVVLKFADNPYNICLPFQVLPGPLWVG